MKDPEQLLRDLVAVNSVNPDLVPGAPGEKAIAAYIAGRLAGAGLEVRVEEPVPGRPNIVGIARGTGGGRTLLLNGHVDTVGVAAGSDLLRPRVEGDRLYGRGAYDMKGGLAACLLAAEEIARRGLRGNVIVTAVMDEEYAGLGTMAVAERYRADGAIVAEPTDLQLVVAHRGFSWLEVETQGVAAHGSRPDLGVDAIAMMGHVLVGVDELGRSLRAGATHPLLGTASLHASLISGGVEMSTYPDRCRLSVERRTLPGETPEAVEGELRAILDRTGRDDPAFRATLRRVLDRAPLETPDDAAVVTAVRGAAERVLGRPVASAGVPYWTDAATLWAAGIPAVLFGPVGEGMHADVEWVSLDSVRQCADVFVATAVAFCG